MTQVVAILLDSYRELNARKLFWITLAISLIIVVAYGSIGFDDKGMTLLFGAFNLEMENFTKDSPWSKVLYMGIFSNFVVGLWLAWIAVILALVSTTSVFPDVVTSGGIDLLLSKPISRFKLFAMKYVGSLLFVLLQVSIFCIGVFFCVGLRVDEWKWEIFLAIPLLVAFFSYLYSVNVLLGITTRSALAALLLTLLFWFMIWAVQQSEEALNQFKTQYALEAENAQRRVDQLRLGLDSLPAEGGDENVERRRSQIQESLRLAETEADDAAETSRKLAAWHVPIQSSLAVLPKTGQTVMLLDRWLTQDSPGTMTDIMLGDVDSDAASQRRRNIEDSQMQAIKRIEEEYRSKSVWYVVGTSLGFELIVLTIAFIIFARRDF